MQDLPASPSSSDPSLSQNPHLSDLIEKRTKNAELREKYQEMCLTLAERQEGRIFKNNLLKSCLQSSNFAKF